MRRLGVVAISAGVILSTSLDEFSWSFIPEVNAIISHVNVDYTRYWVSSIDRSSGGNSIIIWEGTGRNFQFP